MMTPIAAQIAIASNITTSAVINDGSSVPPPSKPRAMMPSGFMPSSLRAACAESISEVIAHESADHVDVAVCKVD